MGFVLKLIVFGFAAVAAIYRPSNALAEVRPNGLISEGMVLQRNRPIKLWGTAEPGESVTVRFRGHEAATTADDAGRWSVTLAEQSAGGPFTLTIEGQNRVRFENVLVGDVWVCSGQSNMWWPVASRPGSKELMGTENPSIRLFTVPARQSNELKSDLESRWQECSPETLVGFSAVAYYFGRQIQQTQQVAIGLIHASYGGSGIEAWIGASALAHDPELAPLRERSKQAAEQQQAQRRRLQAEVDRYLAAVEKAKRDGVKPPDPPRGMADASSSHSQLYNGMIAPLLPYGIRGVLWYQGESNVGRAADYRCLLSALIRSWRYEWRQGEFPFLLVQLAPHRKIIEQPQDSAWARLREAQWQTSLATANTGMAVITDWGHETDIHVKQKQPVGERLALLARALVYEEPVTYSGPMFAAVQREGQHLTIRFDHIGSGLFAKRMVLEDVTKDGRSGLAGGALHVAKDDRHAGPVALQGFAIAGEDRRFVPALAEIRDEMVVVHSPRVSNPIAVRYGWADYPIGNLFNLEGLPAGPFRSDDWPQAVEPPDRSQEQPQPARRAAAR
jgi:sialate O-acetylesterase